MPPYNNRGGYFNNNNRLRGFVSNRSSGFVKNRLNFNNNYRSNNYNNNNNNSYHSTGLFTKRTRGFHSNNGSQNISDARQILQQKNAGYRFRGSITDLSQKLYSRTGNGARFHQRGRGGAVGMITKSRFAGQFNRRFGSNLNHQNRFLNPGMVVNRSRFGVDNAAEKKFVKVHRGGITVTSKQNSFQKRQMPLRDELEEMTLDDLPPPLEFAAPAKNLNPSLEARLQHGIPSQDSNAAATVLVSNLKHSVTEEDIHELFGAVGQMTSAQLVHPGTALVTYVDKESAVTAVEYYNNITLDGVAMHCTILSLDKKEARPSISSRLGDRTSSPLSSSFLSSSHTSAFLPAVPTQNNYNMQLGMRSAGRQVKGRQQFMTRSSYNPEFNVCLN